MRDSKIKKLEATIPAEKVLTDSRAKPAKARKREAKADQCKIQEACEKEVQQWLEAQDTKSRADKRREEKAKRQMEASARKAQARLLAEQEAKDLERILTPKLYKKVTRAERETLREMKLEGEEEEKTQKERRIATKEEYERMILVENRNRDVTVGVETAICL